MLAVSHSVNKQISDLSGSRSGRIVLGVTAVTGEFLLPQIFDDFEREYPQVELILTEEKAGVLQDLVKKGKTDLAFMYQTDLELECHMIAENPVYIQVPPAFTEGKTGWKPGKQNPQIEAQMLQNQSLILLKKGRGMREIAEQFLKQFSVTPARVFETENIHLASRPGGAEPRLYVHSGHCGVAADAGWAERLLLPGEGLSHEAEPVLLLPGAELSDRGGAVSDQSDSEDGAVVGIGASALSGRSAA